MDTKVAIVGAGHVGSTAAYALLLQNVVKDISLIDIDAEKAEGEVLDMEHGLQFLQRASITFGEDLSLCSGADVIVICAGSAQKNFSTRLGLAKENAELFKDLIPKITCHNRDAIYLIITNPVDIMTYLALKYSSLPWTKVIGSGTALDSARFRYYLGERLGIHPRAIHAYILGEHGDSQFPVISKASLSGLRVSDIEGFDQKILRDSMERTRKAAYEILRRKEATYYAIGLIISRIVDSILNDSRDIMPLSVYIDDYYKEGDLCMSVPCLLGGKA